jgi:hypothetical protein
MHGSTFADDFEPPLVEALEPPDAALEPPEAEPDVVAEAEHPTSPQTSAEARRVLEAMARGSRCDRVFVIPEVN